MLGTFFKDSKKYFVVKVVTSCAWIVVLKVYTSYLEPAEFGVYVILLSILAYSLVISNSWLSVAILRFYHLVETEPKKYFYNISNVDLFSIDCRIVQCS